jgi:hypothetical protein
MANTNRKNKKSSGRSFAEMVANKSLGTLLSDRAFEAETDDAEGFNMPFIMGPIFDVIRNINTRTPLTVGIYGGWGTGKTSAMEWLHGIVRESNKVERPETKIVPVWFYPWKYQNKDDVWRGIIAEVILATLDKTTLMEAANADLLTSEGREIILNAAKRFGPALGKTFVSAVSKLSLKASAKAGENEVSIEGTSLKEIIDDLKVNLNPERNYLNSFENELSSWVDKHVKNDERILVFIDDLDRCLPEVTLQVLEALKLYLNIPKLIFVVGVDKDVVEQIVIKHYDTQGVTKEKAEQYLAKMFQIEVQVGPTEQEIGDYFEKAVTGMELWKSIKSEHQEVLGNTIKAIAKRNPREIKRIANAALLGGMGAKWNLSESEDAFAVGVMIYLLKRIPKNKLGDVIGNIDGDKFLFHVSGLVRKIGKDLVLKKLGERENIDSDSSLVEGSSTDDFDRFYIVNRVECERYLSLIDNELILDLLSIPYPIDSGRFAQPSLKQSEGLDALLLLLQEDPNPIELDLHRSNITDESLRILLLLQQLRILSVSETAVTDKGLQFIKRLNSLEVLNLSGTAVTDHGLENLRGLKELRLLNLSRTSIVGHGLDCLSSLERLEELDLMETAVTDNSLEFCGRVSSLSFLRLSKTPITDRGLKNLKCLDKLSCLVLEYTNITDNGLRHLQELKGLRILFLKSTLVTMSGRSEFERNNPGIQILS